MINRALRYIMVIGLLLTGCVSIPDTHGTAGHYNKSGDINTECVTTDPILLRNIPAASLQVAALNSQSFSVLNWNSYNGRNTIWQEEFERLSSQSDLVVLQEGYLTDDLHDLLNKKQYSWDIAKAFTYKHLYGGADRIKGQT